MKCCILHCIALHCIALHCIALHCIALHCIALHCIALHCIALHCSALQCIAVHCSALHCIALHCIALHCIALHCIALHAGVSHDLDTFPFNYVDVFLYVLYDSLYFPSCIRTLFTSDPSQPHLRRGPPSLSIPPRYTKPPPCLICIHSNLLFNFSLCCPTLISAVFD